MTKWVPLRRKDFSFFKNPLDIISYIRNRVVNFNESYDVGVFGKKGSGKSTMALSYCKRYCDRFDVSKHVAFSINEWIDKSKGLKRGDIVMCDEMGTRQFGSSHKWQSTENQGMSDIVQLNRTDGISMIGTSLDEMRITNRVRSTYSVLLHAEEKTKIPVFERDENNKIVKKDGKPIIKEYYLAIKCILRFRKADLFNQNSGNDYLVYPRNGPRCVIKRILLFHPPNDIFEEYSKQRDQLKQKLVDEQRESAARQAQKNMRLEDPEAAEAMNDALLKALRNGRAAKK